jgi:hypothetical protein
VKQAVSDVHATKYSAIRDAFQALRADRPAARFGSAGKNDGRSMSGSCSTEAANGVHDEEGQLYICGFNRLAVQDASNIRKAYSDSSMRK